MTKDQYKKAVDFVKGGGSIAAIESKYTITPEQMEALKNKSTWEWIEKQ